MTLRVDRAALLKLHNDTEEKRRKNQKQEAKEGERAKGYSQFKSISELIISGAPNAELEKAVAKANKEREENAKKELMQKQKEFFANNVVTLPLWAENQRGIPNSMLRGALFAGIGEQHSYICKRENLACCDGISIIYTGIRLVQSDLEVYEAILHLLRVQNMGDTLEVSGADLLKILGKKNPNGDDYAALRLSISKLHGGSIDATDHKKTYMGHLLKDGVIDEKTQYYRLSVHKELSLLFNAGNTWISFEERKAIGGRSPLARWLHGYISTHANWYPHKLETIRALSGCKESKKPDIKKNRTSEQITEQRNKEKASLRAFKQNLKRALDRLKNKGFIDEWEIDKSNKLHIKRTVTDSQKRHIAKSKPA